MKPRDPCYCEAHDFPHRYTVGKRGCYEYVAKPDPYADDYDDSERLLDERDRAADMNAAR
jgi:hypothetical protein